MEQRINNIVGVVCNGIFAAQAADVVIAAGPKGVRTSKIGSTSGYAEVDAFADCSSRPWPLTSAVLARWSNARPHVRSA